jgi:hypothetical protein
MIGCEPGLSPGPSSATTETNASNDSHSNAVIVAYCSDCHQAPDPNAFSKADWPREVHRGYRFQIELGRDGLETPPVSETVHYYVSLAPQTLPQPRPIPFAIDQESRFRRSSIDVPSANGAALAFISWQKDPRTGIPQMFFSDMMGGVVQAWAPHSLQFEVLCETPHPAGIEWCDLDSDGLTDLVVSDLGSFQPADDDEGKILWLRQTQNGKFEALSIAEGLGRVSESRTADFNNDGLVDIVVAEFGWIQTGNILLFFQRLSESGVRTFEKLVVDERHGTIRVPPLDLDGNGLMDFVALVSQEHEAVDVFLNRGNSRFERIPLCNAGDPAFGFSGLQPADLDNDGDTDFIVSNGDMFDSFSIKPYHGLKWLQNHGSLKFTEHPLLIMPGVHGIATGDLDNDGDTDIVASAFFPQTLLLQMSEPERNAVVSAIWLEQTGPGDFQPHLIEQGQPSHACACVADADSDGDLDVILGNFAAGASEAGEPFVIFENAL